VTSDTIDAAAEAADLITRAGLDATYQHIGLLSRKQDQLRASQIAAEEQFLCRVGQLYGTRKINDVELAFLYRAYADFAVPGFLKRWEANIPVPAGRVQYILRHAKTLDLHAPNMPDGTWRGSWPLEAGDRTPIYGACVVYVLYDGANDPCYVGSTQNLKARLKDHRKDGKPFVRWTAFACADREAAYQLEDKLLNEHQPYLNRKRGR
jgi:GIY-YIG catalytic domain-containing protein